jgi:TonB family protein
MFELQRLYDEIESGTDDDVAQSAGHELETRYTANRIALTQWLKKHAARIFVADSQVHQRRRRYAAVAFAVVLNILFVWVAIGSLRFPVTAGTDEIHLILTPFTHADVASLPQVQEPPLSVVEMPEIAIQTEAPRSAPAAVSASAVLAPRPDPAHPNPLPSAAEIEEGNTAAVAMVLKIMVLPDGSVNEAVVVQSSGKHDIDLAAIAFVKAQWRFLPALVDGTPIQYWTTVSLRTG